MSWFFISLIAQFILGTSALFDKVLLGKGRSSPVVYTFWLGILGLVSAILLPFGYSISSAPIILLALGAGAVFMLGMFFFFFALHYSRAGGSIVSVSGFSPIITFIFSYILLEASLAGYQLISFILFIAGAFLLMLLEERGLRVWITTFSVLSAIFLGLSVVLSKLVFNETNFITGFFWIKLGGVLAVLLFLLYPYWRRAIFNTKNKIPYKHKTMYTLNRAYAGAGSVLVIYAVSLGVPSLVDAMQSVRFLFIFIGGWIFFHKRVSWRTLTGELLAFVLISGAVLVLGVGDYLSRTVPDPARSVTWGITFSQKYAGDLGVNSSGDSAENFTWQESYDAIIDDLGVKDIRLIAYWDVIEHIEGVYDFSGLDYQMRRAEEVGAEVILTVGRKVPRWPECHVPEWAKEIPRTEQNQRMLSFAEATINRYKHSSALRWWQVENEPFLAFGEEDCRLSGKELLDAEISLVKQLDPDTPILVTDSGEIGPWFRAAGRGDVFGTTMYRRVYNKFFGQFEYPINPSFFRIKENIVRFFIRDFKKQFVVIELGMEPWLNGGLNYKTPEEQFEVFDIEFFKDSIDFAKDTGFHEYYLWGAEWWYWMKEKHAQPQFWEEAQRLFKNSV